MFLKEVLFLHLLSLVFSCPNGYNPWFDGRCFLLKTGHRLSYDQAVSRCQEDGAWPASIRTEEENKLVIRSTKTSSPFWIGLNVNQLTDSYFWADMSRATYTNLPGGDKKYSFTSHFYVDPSNEKWSEGSSNDGLNSVVCEHPLRSEGVRFQYEQVANLSVKVYNMSKTWDDARARCQSENADLVVIKDAETNQLISDYAAKKGIKDAFFIGLSGSWNDDRTEFKYKWINGDDIHEENGSGEEPFNAFAPNFPDQEFGQFVAMRTMYFAGMWTNVNNGSSLPFLCARPINEDLNDDVNATCTAEVKTEDEGDFFSPSYPNNAGPRRCDYMIKRNISTRISLKIVFLEANSCCDSLLIYEGLYGTTPKLQLTGYIPPTSTGRDVLETSSSIIRMVWNATSSEHTRGFHLRYIPAPERQEHYRNGYNNYNYRG